MKSDFADYIQASKSHVDNKLTALAVDDAEAIAEIQPSLDRLFHASQYSLTNGGKRVRAMLVYSACRAVNPRLDIADLDLVACSIEMMHSYSLVHDDLPAMDDDDLRRGQASCHKAYDEPTAVLVGDGLQARAFELLADAREFSEYQRLFMIKTLAAAAGLQGMVGGQAIDIAAVDSALTLSQLAAMYALKTGALIRAALAMGGIAAGATEGQLAALEEYGSNIGLAFQVVDDILDVEADTATLGKTQGKDRDANKPTYVKLMGLEEAKAEAKRLLEAALAALNKFGESADHLRDLARYIVERDR